jgi:hypothetical protein
MAAAPVRKEPAPSSATDRLASTQAALAQANARIAELTEQRNKALLASDDDTSAIKLGGEIDALRQAARAHGDKIALLKEQAAEEDAARRAKEREVLIERIEKKIAQRDAAMEGVAAAIKQLAAASERAIALGREIANEWQWPAHDLPVGLFTVPSIDTAISNELFKTSHHPRRFGGADTDVLAGHSLPGSRAPTFQLAEDPARVRPMVDIVREASEFARRFLRTGQGSSAIGHTQNISTVSPPIPTNGGGAAARSEVQQRYDALLVQMDRLRQDPTPAGEAEYLRVVGELTKVSAELEAQRQVEAQHV